MRVMELFQAGVAGIKRQLDAMDAAATRVLVESTAPNTADRVSVSTTAKEAATSGTSRTGGIEGALVDLRVSKYLAVANMKVLKTGDDMTKELTELVK